MKVNLKILPFMKLTMLDRENSSTGAIAKTELETKWGGLYNENFCMSSRKMFWKLVCADIELEFIRTIVEQSEEGIFLMFC